MNGLLALLAECKVAEENGRVETKSVHIFRSGGVDFAGACEDGALGFCFRGSFDVWNTHEPKKFLAVIVMFSRHPNSTSRELFNLFSSTSLLCFFMRLFGFRFALKSLC